MKLFDGHGDVWTDIAQQRLEHGMTDVFRKRHLAKFEKGGVFGGIFVIWVDPPYDETDPAGRSLQILGAIEDEMKDADDILMRIRTFDDFAAAKEAGKLAIVTGMEGASQVGEDLEQIDYYYERAHVRDIMLTWNEVNPLATPWVSDLDRGLTELGKKAVRHIQDLGINIDVSHLNDKSFWDVMSAANGPVIASHSNCRSICDLERNLSDEMIREIAATGGLVGLNSIRQLTTDDHDHQDLDFLMNHLDHLIEVAGIDHVGLGFDFDDYFDLDTLAAFIFDSIETPSCLNLSNEAEAGNIIPAMKARGYSQEDMKKIAYGNFMKLFRDTWKA